MDIENLILVALEKQSLNIFADGFLKGELLVNCANKFLIGCVNILNISAKVIGPV